MRTLELTGSRSEIGYAHGNALASEIETCLSVYEQVIGTPFAELRSRADELEKLIRAFSPDLLEEIYGIAEGAGVDPFRIILLNARSELMSTTSDGCTALFQPSIKTLGQTWDWIEALEDLFVILRIKSADGHQLLTVTEPGMVGKIGLNSSGIGCTLNFLYSPGQHLGLPVHLMLRSILDSKTLDDALAAVNRSQPGQSGNLMIGSDTGVGYNVELAGLEKTIESLGSGPFVHTNHHLKKQISAGVLGENSRARFATANRIVAETCLSDSSICRQLLSDTSDTTNPICADYKPQLGTKIGTVCTVLMNLADRSLDIRRGPNPAAPFKTIGLAT